MGFRSGEEVNSERSDESIQVIRNDVEKIHIALGNMA
jgi:hypothetical protein